MAQGAVRDADLVHVHSWQRGRGKLTAQRHNADLGFEVIGKMQISCSRCSYFELPSHRMLIQYQRWCRSVRRTCVATVWDPCEIAGKRTGNNSSTNTMASGTKRLMDLMLTLRSAGRDATLQQPQASQW